MLCNRIALACGSLEKLRHVEFLMAVKSMFTYICVENIFLKIGQTITLIDNIIKPAFIFQSVCLIKVDFCYPQIPDLLYPFKILYPKLQLLLDKCIAERIIHASDESLFFTVLSIFLLGY